MTVFSLQNLVSLLDFIAKFCTFMSTYLAKIAGGRITNEN